MATRRRMSVLNIGDDVTHECLASVADTSISGSGFVRELTAVVERRGRPDMVVSDNGTEFTSNAVLSWTSSMSETQFARVPIARRIFRFTVDRKSRGDSLGRLRNWVNSRSSSRAYLEDLASSSCVSCRRRVRVS